MSECPRCRLVGILKAYSAPLDTIQQRYATFGTVPPHKNGLRNMVRYGWIWLDIVGYCWIYVWAYQVRLARLARLAN